MCPAVQRIAGTQRRIARGAGASDGDPRGARHHKPLAPTDVQPVLDAIVESGINDVVLRLRDGDVKVVRAHFGSVPSPLAAKRSALMNHKADGSAVCPRVDALLSSA